MPGMNIGEQDLGSAPWSPPQKCWVSWAEGGCAEAFGFFQLRILVSQALACSLGDSSSLSFSTSLPLKTVLLYDMCLLTFTSCNLYIWEKYSVIITELL